MDTKQIINKFKEKIGEPLTFSLAGSHALNLNSSESDYDYCSIINNKISDITIRKKYKIENSDIFYLPVTAINDITVCSTIFFLQDIKYIIYAKSNILEYIKENKNNLININPYGTYKTAIGLIDHDKEWGFQFRQIQFAEILKNFYYYGDFSKSLELSEETKKLYRELKDGKKVLSEFELNQYLEVLYTPSFKNYFYTFEPNVKLHQEFVKVLNEGGELNGIT